MKMAKIRKKDKKGTNNIKNQYSFKTMFLTVIIIVAIFGIFYFITTLLVEPVEEEIDSQVVIDSTQITINQLLDRSEEEYYVLAIRGNQNNGLGYLEADYSQIYNDYINMYKMKEDALPFYYINLDDALNQSNVSDEMNISDNIEELKLNDDVLFRINGGKIEKTYIGKEKILDKLSRL